MKQAAVRHTFQLGTPLHVRAGRGSLGSVLAPGPPNLDKTRKQPEMISHQGKKHTRKSSATATNHSEFFCALRMSLRTEGWALCSPTERRRNEVGEKPSQLGRSPEALHQPA